MANKYWWRIYRCRYILCHFRFSNDRNYHKRIKKRKFSIWGFWKRRAKRICPALLSAIILFYLISFFLLVNVKEFYEFNKEATSALAFISNFRFAKDEGYFAIDSMSKMLLHTWSLSVEWQFYVIYPILLWALNKVFNLKAIKIAVVILFIISIGFVLRFDGQKYYYMLYTRAWELLAGAIVFLFPIKYLLNLPLNSKRILEFIGLILIVSIFVRNNNDIWTAIIVIPSIIGTMLIINLASEKSILSNSIFQYLGKISYSLYIYHWLVLSICARINLSSNLYFIGASIFVLSMLSYHFIESSRNYGWKFLVIYLAMIGITTWTVDQHGFKDRYPNIEVEFGGENSADFHPGFNNQDHKADVVLIGDSHAKQYWSYFNNHNINAAIFATSGTYCFDENNCSFSKPNFIDIINNDYGSIHNFVNERQKFIESFSKSTPIIISQRWTQHFNSIVEDWFFACANNSSLRDNPQSKVLDESLGKVFLQNSKHHFYVLGSLFGSHAIYTVRECNNIPNHNKYLPNLILDNLKCSEAKLKYGIEYKNINLFLKNYLKKFNNVTFIDPNTPICSGDYCKLMTDKNEAIFWDDNHLSIAGAELIGSHIMNNIKK